MKLATLFCFVLFAVSGCGGGGGGTTATSTVVPVTDPADSNLVWDESNWDEGEWE